MLQVTRNNCYNHSMETRIPLIIGFIADLFFSVKVEDAARRLNYRIEWIERPDQVDQPEDPLTGIGDALLDKLSLLKPALILFDLNNTQIPWRQWIPLIKTSPATRRIPVVCFGSHMDVDAMKAARSGGADAVLARSQFTASLPDLIQKYARIPDYAALEQACGSPLSAVAVQGLEEFNRGEYFEAHELLEEAWNEDETPGRELYRAILQVAVAYLQIERGNYPGAVKMFLRLRQWIDPLPGSCRGIDVNQLRSDANQVYQSLLSLGPQGITKFDRRLFKPVIYGRIYS